MPHLLLVEIAYQCCMILFSSILQTDTSLAIETKFMQRWEFDSIAQAVSCMSSWFSGTVSEKLLFKEYLDSAVGIFRIFPYLSVWYGKKKIFWRHLEIFCFEICNARGWNSLIFLNRLLLAFTVSHTPFYVDVHVHVEFSWDAIRSQMENEFCCKFHISCILTASRIYYLRYFWSVHLQGFDVLLVLRILQLSLLLCIWKL